MSTNESTYPMPSSVMGPQKNSFIYNKCQFCVNIFKWVPVVFITAVLAWGYYAYVFELCISTMESVILKIVCLICFHFFYIMTFWSYWQTIIAKPGVVPRSFWFTYADFERLQKETTEEGRTQIISEIIAERQLPVLCRTYSGSYRLCEKCKYQNWCQIFGTSKLKWFLPMYTSIGDGVQYPVKIHSEHAQDIQEAYTAQKSLLHSDSDRQRQVNQQTMMLAATQKQTNFYNSIPTSTDSGPLAVTDSAQASTSEVTIPLSVGNDEEIQGTGVVHKCRYQMNADEESNNPLLNGYDEEANIERTSVSLNEKGDSQINSNAEEYSSFSGRTKEVCEKFIESKPSLIAPSDHFENVNLVNL
ncbi:palmitoyltransferase ZDHHC2-like protein [Dinothrombium tinctorium]|uniref:Palmitoyltransferase ZDHHC2-like protein n=1 Tax=Dinothrombium tinctorium TaxID=1965070 RepID=A0A443QPD4_9ACAR|nr:palmitoyltransferase ZDHHC2-like protein [Dinothrombium tinctorium]